MSAETRGVDRDAVRANKLELVERLADHLAHEIKNPLHSMVINLEVLKRRIARDAPAGADELLRYAGILDGELDRVSRRIDLLLRMVRPDRASSAASLAGVVDELLELVALERERREIQLEYHPGPQPVTGHLPLGAARQLVLNVLLAGLDLAPRRGTIRVDTESYTGAERLRLQVARDPGADAGHEGDAPRLAIARSLAEALGGRLERDEQPGEVTLLLELPARSR